MEKFEKCKIINKRLQDRILKVPEFRSRIYLQRDAPSDEAIYALIKSAYDNMDRSNPLFFYSCKAVREVETNLFGKPITPYAEVILQENDKDLAYLIGILEPIGKDYIQSLMLNRPFLRAVRNHGEIHDLQEAYSVFSVVFFRMVRSGYKSGKKQWQVDTYYRFRAIAMRFCIILYDDPDQWRMQYAKRYDRFIKLDNT